MRKSLKVTQATKSFDAVLMIKTVDVHARLALFLTGEVGSCNQLWKGKLSAAEQIALFGKKLAHPLTKFFICGETSTISTYKSVCFGTMSEMDRYKTWAELA